MTTTFPDRATFTAEDWTGAICECSVFADTTDVELRRISDNCSQFVAVCDVVVIGDIHAAMVAYRAARVADDTGHD